MSLLEPILDYEFMRNGLIAATLIGAACATLGCYVVLRQMAFIGDAMAHTALPGLAVAYLKGWSLFIGALVADLLTALGIALLSRRKAVREDTAIGVLFTGMFASGVLLIAMSRSYRDFSHMLLGNVLGVTRFDLLLMAGITAAVLLTLALLHKELELTSFDPGYAQVIGLRPSRLRLVLLILLAFTVVSAIQAVGVILTSALLVTPAAAASLITRRLTAMMALAAFIAIFSGVVGLYLSYYLDVASGPAIVVTCTACFGLAYVYKLFAHRQAAPRPA